VNPVSTSNLPPSGQKEAVPDLNCSEHKLVLNSLASINKLKLLHLVTDIRLSLKVET